MPKPGTVNTLLTSPFKTGLTSIATRSIPQTSPTATAQPFQTGLSTIGARAPQPAPAPTSQPAVSSTAAPPPPVNQPQQQQFTGGAMSNTSDTGHTTALPGGTGAPPAFNPTFTGLVGQLGQYGAQPSPATQQALGISQNSADTYNRLNTELEQSRANEANAEAQNRLNPIPIGDQTGREAVIRNQYLAQQNAIASQAQGATALFSPAISAATTGQGQQITATQGAASLAQPQPYSPTNVPFNPAGGNFGNPASTAYGANGLAGLGATLQQQQQGGDVQTMTSSYNQTAGLIDNFNNNFAATFNQNPTALGNALTQWVNTGVVPDPQYNSAIATLQEIASTIAPVLGTPGNPTDLKTLIANELVPRLMQGQGITQVLQQLENNAATKIAAAKQVATGTPLSTPSPSSQTSSTGGGSIWSF